MTLAPGAPFPSIFLPRVGGGAVHFATGPALLFVFQADCEASTHAARALARIAERLLPRGLVVAGLSQDDEATAAAFAATHGLGAIDLCVDADSLMASSALEIERTPTAYLVDEGRIVVAIEGWSRHDYNALAVRAAELVGSEAPSASARGDGLPESTPPSLARNAG